jgi:hypothetical protein
MDEPLVPYLVGFLTSFCFQLPWLEALQVLVNVSQASAQRGQSLAPGTVAVSIPNSGSGSRQAVAGQQMPVPLQLNVQALLALFASGRTTSLVVSFGSHGTDIFPIYEGFAVLPCQVRVVRDGGMSADRIVDVVSMCPIDVRKDLYANVRALSLPQIALL